jgi:hypothetical protein
LKTSTQILFHFYKFFATASVGARPVWQGLSRNSLKFHPGLSCLTFLCPVGRPPPKWPYSHFGGGCPPCGRPLTVLYPLQHPMPYGPGWGLHHMRSCPTQILTRRLPASPDVREGGFSGGSVVLLWLPSPSHLTLSFPLLTPTTLRPSMVSILTLWGSMGACRGTCGTLGASFLQRQSFLLVFYSFLMKKGFYSIPLLSPISSEPLIKSIMISTSFKSIVTQQLHVVSRCSKEDALEIMNVV